ncbi:ankyrin repeat-containing protein ITN1-like [Neltuma alba]|uniref:ankyrin repeat-containing protein ITN1-like n=1 Tax=Neltuma alba TaxID=207710 RepID=UPI0010A370A6|nr:ankyrin repeat-containing protein ITN1-like [Prosopis alba]
MMRLIREPSQIIFNAAEVGNFEFLVELFSSYPDLISEKDSRNRSIIHIAVLYRHASVFNLIHETGPNMDSIVSSVDVTDKCNLLHFAAKLAPQNRLDLFSGAAFQMMVELLWFEEVKKILRPSFMEMKNSEGLTPRELFTKEHKKLLKEAESWMKGTAKSCMVVSTLIATGVFSAAFTIPGANNNDTGDPNYLKKLPFQIFAVSDASAFISSSTSILIFLSILISRYAEQDFLKSLPSKLISGLIALFISIICMMVAFSSAFFVTYYHGPKWVPWLISALAFVPIPLFLFLQFPLCLDILYTKYFFRSLFRPNNHILY